MVFLIVFSVLVCLGWSKYSWYQDSNLCYLDSMIEECRSCLFCLKQRPSYPSIFCIELWGWSKPFPLNPLSLTIAFSLKIKAVCIGIIHLILLMHHKRSVNTSSASSWIFKVSMSIRDTSSATTLFCFFPGRYSNITPYSSRSKSHHRCKTRSEAFKSLKVLFLWSVKTMIVSWKTNRIFLYSLHVSIADNKSLCLWVVVYYFWAVFSFRE
jgi:hypothetical protein